MDGLVGIGRTPEGNEFWVLVRDAEGGTRSFNVKMEDAKKVVTGEVDHLVTTERWGTTAVAVP